MNCLHLQEQRTGGCKSYGGVSLLHTLEQRNHVDTAITSTTFWYVFALDEHLLSREQECSAVLLSKGRLHSVTQHNYAPQYYLPQVWSTRLP